MTITIEVERPKPIFMEKSEYTRKGSWDWTGLSDEEIKAELDESYTQAKKDDAEGKGQPAAEFFKQFKEANKEWFTK